MVRLASIDDVPNLVALIQAFYEESNYQIEADVAASAFSSLLGNPDYGAAWVFYESGVPAGYLVLTVCFSMESGGLTGFIDDLFVSPEHRRRGLGRAAIEAAFEECRRRGISTLQVVVGSGSVAALQLYSSCGFRLPDDDRQTLMAQVGATFAG